MVMEFIGAKTLYAYLKSQPRRRIREEDARHVFRQIVEGVAYCHSKNVVHRDIKLENVMVDAGNNVKIIDFGFSITAAKGKKLSIFCGTPSYMAPEMVRKVDYCGQKVDVWALGILLYTMLCGRFPFKGETRCS